MLRHDLRRALLSPRTLFVALAYGVLLSLGATETWNDSAAYQFAFSYKSIEKLPMIIRQATVTHTAAKDIKPWRKMPRTPSFKR